MTKIADHPPAFCAACFTVTPGMRYVDFEAAYDGPVIIGEEDHNGNRTKTPIDDLVLCEDCVASAADKLDLAGDKDELARMASLLERADTDIEARDRMIQRLEMTLAELVDHPIKRRDGVGNFAGLPDEISAVLTKRRAERVTRSRRSKRAMRKQEEETANA